MVLHKGINITNFLFAGHLQFSDSMNLRHRIWLSSGNPTMPIKMSFKYRI